jgi:hypothetical protein
MSIARKSMVSLAAVLMTFAYVAPSFAAAEDIFLTIRGIEGESVAGGNGLPVSVVACVSLFGVQICVPG